jgi:hypothetical protein
MKPIPALLFGGMLAVSGWAEGYSPELVKKAEAGDAEAQYNLGQCYENGQVGIKDNKDAVKWYTKSAEQGYVKAEYSLSQCCKFGKGVPRDKKEAKKWSDKVLAHASADELWLFSQWRVNPTRQEEGNQEIEKRSYELVDEEFEYLHAECWHAQQDQSESHPVWSSSRASDAPCLNRLDLPPYPCKWQELRGTAGTLGFEIPDLIR